jgi:multicomponent Na+:H+ antiporter subunit B
MNAYLLQIAEKYVRWFLLIMALLALLRGHNLPGGGFIGGLLAALSVVFRGLAFNPHYARERLFMSPDTYMGLGLLFIILSLVPALFFSEPFMTGYWLQIKLAPEIVLKLGTPFLFDIGVFFIVIGVTLTFLFSKTKFDLWN